MGGLERAVRHAAPIAQIQEIAAHLALAQRIRRAPIVGGEKMEIADLHAYQASAEGMIGRQVHDLVSITGDLSGLAAVPRTRQLLAGERNDLQAARAQLDWALWLIANDLLP
jgi:hypothetical protein